MKKIEAIIRPAKLEEVKESLGEYGIHGMTVSEVAGCGLQKGKVGVYRGNEFNINLLPKVKLELVTTDNRVEEVVNIIARVARSGEIGDGKIFVYPVENAVRIRTGEQGDEAI
ncbi:nitrogen regulatory protein P-II 1 [Desulfohalotomaculum tongense]|uniref:P-II family nitrogen regulator n=1 Tax=Desulforadius tongensis TaxID=1216062 RepID=UPI00195C2B34|nr:P-II family nitrogen regulator [Desulforadius tongensis]MBM7854878.1 nitrogen regulatory protein P-II 1 [Desulforadius tongensis]